VVSTTGVPTEISVLKGRRQRKSNLPAQRRSLQVLVFRMIRKIHLEKEKKIWVKGSLSQRLSLVQATSASMFLVVNYQEYTIA
jgi:hypothetical protein